MRNPKFWGLHARPGKKLTIALMIIPFLLVLISYIALSEIRHAENPKDKIMPTISKIADTAYNYAFVPDKKGNYRLLNDSITSLVRLVAGISLAAFVGLMIGMNMALFKGMNITISPFVTFLSIIPPLALLPAFMITMGTGEVAKIGLIFIGVVFMITRDIYRETLAIPKEQITKALTLGATQTELIYKIVLPQILPALISTVRLNLGSAWLFLIAGEAMAAKAGLGYTIFLVKRYLAMDVIIVYVFTITGFGFAIDQMLKKLIDRKYPWYIAIKGDS